MRLDAGTLRRLSPLLDEALELDPPEREAWLAGLTGESADLAPVLRRLLLDKAATETCRRMDGGPDLAALSGTDGSRGAQFSAGQTIGPYRLLRELGVGGMGEVWLAERSDGALEREVALKLPQHISWRPGMAERFARERDILARLEHPNIARLYDAGLSSVEGPGRGIPYLALEYVQGMNLTSYCDQHGLGIAARLALATQVLEAVQYAHTRLVIHRDLKPANILVSQSGQVRLLDFGVAKLLIDDGAGLYLDLTQIGGPAFTPDFASPEQVRGETLGTASDVYSLGAVLYELLCGQRPYRLSHSSRAQLELAIVQTTPEPPSSRLNEGAAMLRGTTLARLRKELRGELDTIILKALKKRPEERYATVAELQEDLRRYRAGETVLARPDSLSYRTRKYILRNKIAVGGVSAFVLTVCVGLGISMWQYTQVREQARIARDEARISAAVQAFMGDIFRVNSNSQPDPVQARQTTAEQLLDIAAGKMGGAMQEVPVARLKMLRLLTDLYVQHGLYDKAIATSGLAVETASSPEIPGEELLASMEQNEKVLDFALRLDEEEKMLQRRIALVDKLKISDPKTRGKIELALGGFALQRRPAEALNHVELAIELLRSARAEAELMEALLYKANLLNGSAGYKPAVARSCALEAQAIFERIKATAALDGVQFREANIYQELAQSSMMLDDPGAAVQYARRAEESALSMHDRDDNMARWHSYVLAVALVASAKPLEAIEFLDHSWRLSDSLSPEIESPQQMLVLMASARAQAGAGRSEDALATVDRGLRLSQHVPMQSHWPARLHATRAMALMQLGRLDAAQAELAQATEGFEAAKQATDTLLLLTAELRLAQHDVVPARKLVQTWMASPTASVSLRDRIFASSLLAEAALTAADLVEAERLDSEVLQRIRNYAQRPVLADLEAQALWISARILLAGHHAAAAVPVLKEAVALQESVVDARVNLKLAAMLANLAQAQIRIDDVAHARQTLERTRQIHAQHSNLGSAPRSNFAKVAAEVQGVANRGGLKFNRQ